MARRRDYEPDTSQIEFLYQQLEDDIISSMVKRMMKMGYVSESTRYEAEVLQAAGLLYDDIAQMIADRSDTSTELVKGLFKDAGVQTIQLDNAAYRQAGAAPIDIRQDEGMRQILDAGYRKTSGTMKNLVSTTASQSEQQFISACDRAYMQVASGAFSYQQAIMMAVRGFGDVGAMVQYPSGHRDRLDVAVRRAVLTGVGQTSARISLKRSQDAGCNFMELTAHSGARPEHAAWQGQLVSLDGSKVGQVIDGMRVFSLNDIGYGTGAGFKGWNCRHNWHPYFVGLSTPNYTPEELAALDAKNIPYNGKMYSEYEICQIQRAKERTVRAWKRRVIAAQSAAENAQTDAQRAAAQTQYERTAKRLKAAEKRLDGFCKATGRRNDTFRSQVAGFGRSEAQKAVHANKRLIARLGTAKKSQFRRIKYDTANPITAQRRTLITLQRVINATNIIYVSDGARADQMKPKRLHQIDMHLSDALKKMGIENASNLPAVYVIDGMEMSTSAAASYNPILNVLYVNKEIAVYKPDSVPDGMEQFASYKNDLSSYIHELYHWVDAEKFRQKYGEVTVDNYQDYIEFINKEAKKHLDKLVKKGYNVNGISQYATDEYKKLRYYETYTEYRVIDLLER